jgi:hypothetical protein
MDLTKQINQILTEYASDVDKVVLQVEDEVSKEAVKKLKATSPKAARNGGHRHYADDWTVDNKSKKTYSQYIIKNKQYQLTHLLENGHDVVSHGKKVGHVSGRPHIKPVEEWCKTEVEKRIRKELST